MHGLRRGWSLEANAAKPRQLLSPNAATFSIVVPPTCLHKRISVTDVETVAILFHSISTAVIVVFAAAGATDVTSLLIDVTRTGEILTAA